MALEHNDIRQLFIQRDMIHAHLGNVIRMLNGVREGTGNFTTANVMMDCAQAENFLEAALAGVRKAKAEARLITYQREKTNPVYDLTQRLPSPRPSAGLPACGSFAAE